MVKQKNLLFNLINILYFFQLLYKMTLMFRLILFNFLLLEYYYLIYWFRILILSKSHYYMMLNVDFNPFKLMFLCMMYYVVNYSYWMVSFLSILIKESLDYWHIFFKDLQSSLVICSKIYFNSSFVLIFLESFYFSQYYWIVDL